MAKRVHKIKLILPADYSFKLIGIVSSENDYTVSWAINDALNITFKKDKPLEVVVKKTNLIKEFTRFSFKDENLDIKYTLIANKSKIEDSIEEQNVFISNNLKTDYLIKEQKQIDYFFKIEAEANPISPNIIKKIKSSKAILATFDILPTDLKSKYDLLF